MHLCHNPSGTDPFPSFSAPLLRFSSRGTTERSLDHGGGHEPDSRVLRGQGCHYSQLGCFCQGERALHQGIRQRPGLLAFPLLSHQRLLPALTEHPANALRLSYARADEGLPRPLAQARLLYHQQRQDRLQQRQL